MSLELSSLKKAVSSLERAVGVATRDIRGAVDTDREEVTRAGVIQNFEFTFELSWKFMKRWLENNGGGSVIDGLSMKELFRMAAERHLITDVEAWFKYHRMRNRTSHTYDEPAATEVYSAAMGFAKDARRLLEALESKND